MNKENIKKIVQAALVEDIGSGDITTLATVSSAQKARAVIVCQATGVVCGLAYAREVFKSLDPNMTIRCSLKDGDALQAGQVILDISGKAQAILTGERVALNFIGYLSGIATRTRQYVEALGPARVVVLDTRKTTPTLRALERLAVRCGGAQNHRFDLGKMVLVKDNHRALLDKGRSLASLVNEIRKKTSKPIEVEVDTLDELRDVLLARPDMVLLDNMSLPMLRQAVKLVMRLPKARRPVLEASGGITLKAISKVAATGIDRISVGALTHSHQSLDVSLEII